MLLIGSKAIRYHFPDFPREPKDEDYAVNYKVINDTKGFELLYNPVIGNAEGVADPNTLCTLKASHLVGWDINWSKHMFDVQFLVSKGCRIIPELFYEFYRFWNSYHGKNRRSVLDMSAEDFFDNAVSCEHDHDYIHTLLKDYPTYKKVLKDGAEVDVSEDKFNSLSYSEKCDLVTEEVMVMAYERYSSLGYMHAYDKMLKKFILNHAPLWEAVFIIENFKHLHKPKFDYLKTINHGLQKAK